MNQLNARVHRLARGTKTNDTSATCDDLTQPRERDPWADFPAARDEVARFLHSLAERAKGEADRSSRSKRDGIDVRELLKLATDEELHWLRERLRELPTLKMRDGRE